MPEKLINSRRSIHAVRDTKTPRREESDGEDNLIIYDSQDQSSDSISETEDNINDTKFGMKKSRSVPRTLKTKVNPVHDIGIIPETKEKYSPIKKKLLWLTIGIIIGGVLLNKFFNTKRNCSFENLEKKYPDEKSLVWRTLAVGIESILNARTQNPAVYLFIYYEGQHVYKLIRDIAAHSSSCFDQKMMPIEMDSDDFINAPGAEDDYGYVIEKFKTKIKDGNVVLIANLNQVPAKAARAMHTICDTHNPIAKDVVIFLTLTIPPNIGGSAVAKAEKTLNELWGSKLGDNELDPLITRVTDQVIFLQSKK